MRWRWRPKVAVAGAFVAWWFVAMALARPDGGFRAKACWPKPFSDASR